MAASDPQYPHLDIRYLGRALARHAGLIAAIVLVAFFGVYFLSGMRTPSYSSTSDVRVTPLTSEGERSDAEGAMGNEIYIIQSTGLAEQVKLELGADAWRKVNGVSVSQVEGTDILRIRASSSNPEIARDAANAYASNYETFRKEQLESTALTTAESLQEQVDQKAARLAEIEPEIAAGGPGSELLLLERATLNQEINALNAEIRSQQNDAAVASSTVEVVKRGGLPRLADSPNPLRDAGVALALAVLFSIGLAVLLEQVDTRIKTPDQVERAAGGLPVLGSIPYSGGRRPSRFRTIDRELVAPTSPAAEAYRTLATSLRFSSLGKEKRTILVTSSSGGEGKTTVAANLAAVLAESGLRVVIVSADLRRPMLGDLLQVDDTAKGLTSAMLGDDELSSCFVSVPLPSGRSLLVLPAGPLPHEPAVLLGSDMFGTVLDRIKRAGADFIIIDCAPVLPVSDPLAASRHVDGVIVLSHHGKTKVGSLAETIDRLEQVDADVIGVVLNGVPAKSNLYGYYGYRAYERKEPSKKAKKSSSAAPPPPPPAGESSGVDLLAKDSIAAAGDGSQER